MEEFFYCNPPSCIVGFFCCKHATFFACCESFFPQKVKRCRRLLKLSRDLKFLFSGLQFISLNLIVFIISIKTEASLLALAKSILNITQPAIDTSSLQSHEPGLSGQVFPVPSLNDHSFSLALFQMPLMAIIPTCSIYLLSNAR